MSTDTLIRISPQAALDLPALSAAVRSLDGKGNYTLLLADDYTGGQPAVTVAAWLALQTTDLRIVAEVPVTHTEPFHGATATATLDHASRGRAGWAPTVQTSPEAAAVVGRRAAAGAEAAWREVGDVADTVRALWTSWDADAEIRDEATHRFIDRERVHYVDAVGTDTAGETWTVRGPSIVPRSPQGELPTTVTVDTPEAVTVAAAVAGGSQDVLIVGDGFRRGDGSGGRVVEITDTAGLLSLAACVGATTGARS
ncbi:LLM class flavin-dependent oxidoreductase [Corynebacterium sp. AOP40-9SA-29]|uniref:LLM class flavin-dependent oxidoreductase n=1 Tax=Corynebacterium sp. AOP40-9SA-29 TaxID=3457677 RepID=UPI004034BDBC